LDEYIGSSPSNFSHKYYHIKTKKKRRKNLRQEKGF